MRVRVCGPGATPVENIVHVEELHVHIDPGTTCWSDSGVGHARVVHGETEHGRPRRGARRGLSVDEQNGRVVVQEPRVDAVTRRTRMRESRSKEERETEINAVYMYILARIHRRRASGQCPEAARGCSCESGIMVLKQQSRTQNKEHPIDATTQPSRSHPNRV